MKVEVAHFADAGERDSDGRYDYYYEGDTYTFSASDERVVVRVYVEDPDIGSTPLTSEQLGGLRLTPEVVTYLRTEGVHTLRCLGPDGTFVAWTGSE